MTKHDDKIKVLLATVELQKNNLGTKPRASWKTNGIFKYKDSAPHFNINTARDPQQLVDALAYLLEKQGLQSQAAHRLDVDLKPMEWDGYPVSEWESDFKQRVEILKWEARKAQLTATETKLQSRISEDAKTEKELEEIEKSMGL